MRILFKTTVLAFIISLNILSAQENEGFLEVKGITEHMMDPLAGSTVKLIKDNSVDKTITSSASGRFQFELEFNHDYVIEVSKKGYLSKRIEFKTHVPDAMNNSKYVNEFAIGLIEPCEGVNYGILEKPVDIITFNEKKNQFVSDKKYALNIAGEMEVMVWAIQECLRDKYDQIVDEADKLFNEGKYKEAKNKYGQAVQADPYDRYPPKKIDEIDRILAQQKLDDQKYHQSIEMADQYFDQGNMEMAKNYYQLALELKNEEYPQQRINEINSALNKVAAEQQQAQEQDRQYNSLLSQANAAYMSKNFETAKSLYSQASQIKPGESLPKQKLAEVQAAEASDKQAAEQKAKQEQMYTSAIQTADNLLKMGELEQAMQAYNKALTIKPGESYAMQKVSGIQRELTEKRQSEAKEKVKQAALQNEITKADDLMQANDLQAAKLAYNRALQIDPASAYAQQKVREIEQLIDARIAESAAKEQAKNEDYNAAMNQARSLMNMGEYDQAKEYLSKAALLKPNEDLPRQKLEEVNRAVASLERQKQEQMVKEAAYKNSVSEAERLLSAGNLVEAKAEFKKALAVNPDDAYASQKVQEITAVQEQALQEEAIRKANDEAFRRKVEQADMLFDDTQYMQSRQLYVEANQLKPESLHVVQRINEIDHILSQLADKEEKQKEINRRYVETIKTADNSLSLEEYNRAREEYQRASVYKPDETYPKQKIAEIDAKLEQLRKEQAQLAVKRAEYQNVIANADRLFNTQSYNDAIQEYTKAKIILPGESYPDNKISEINRILEEQRLASSREKALRDNYNAIIQEADALYNQKNYEEAKTKYQAASNVIPAEAYPKNKINEINTLLAQLEKERMQKEDVQRQYDAAIASADEFYNSKNYVAARDQYEKASSIKTDEDYPRKRIKQINDLLALLAKSSSTTTKPVTQTQPKAEAKIDKLVFKNPSEKENYKKGLLKKYPLGVTQEVYEDKFKTTNRYIVIRNGEVEEFREIVYSWGKEYYHYDIPTTALFFDQQTKRRGDEAFNKVNK